MPFIVIDRMVFAWACSLCPKAPKALAIVQSDTVLRWHRAGFRCYWRWKSKHHQGRPTVPAEVRQLIQSCGWYRGDGPACRSDSLFSTALWDADHRSRAPTNPLARRHIPANGGMDGQSTDCCLGLGADPSRSD